MISQIDKRRTDFTWLSRWFVTSQYENVNMQEPTKSISFFKGAPKLSFVLMCQSQRVPLSIVASPPWVVLHSYWKWSSRCFASQVWPNGIALNRAHFWPFTVKNNVLVWSCFPCRSWLSYFCVWVKFQCSIEAGTNMLGRRDPEYLADHSIMPTKGNHRWTASNKRPRPLSGSAKLKYLEEIFFPFYFVPPFRMQTIACADFANFVIVWVLKIQNSVADPFNFFLGAHNMCAGGANFVLFLRQRIFSAKYETFPIPF